jgi:hypothetical protein
MEKKSFSLSNHNYNLLSDDLFFDEKAKIFSDLYLKKNIDQGEGTPVDHILLLIIFDFIEKEMENERRILYLNNIIS